MSYIALYQGTASEAAEKVRNADSSWAEAHSEWQEERTCTAHLKVRPFKTHGKCLFSAASEAVPFQNRFMKPVLLTTGYCYSSRMVLQLVGHSDGQPANTLTDLLRLGVGEVQPHVRAGVTAGIEGVTGNESDVLAQGSVQQLHGVNSRRQGHPQEQPAFRMRPCHLRREVVVESLQHGVAAFTIDTANKFDVLFEEAILGDFVGDHLVEGAGVEVGALLQLHQTADDVRWGNDPAQA